MLWLVAVIGWLRTLPDSPPRVIGSFSSGSEQEAGSLTVHGAEDFLWRHRLVDVRTILIGQGSFRWLPVHFKISSHRQREMTHYRLMQGDMQDLFHAINTPIHPESQTTHKVQTWWYINDVSARKTDAFSTMHDFIPSQMDLIFHLQTLGNHIFLQYHDLDQR